MNRQLTQQEIDAAFIGQSGGKENRAAVKLFDFTRLDRIPKAQIRALHQLHENFIRGVTSSLGAYLRTYVSMNLVSMEQISYAEYLDGLSSPTLIAYLGLSPYDGVAVMEISPGLVFTMLETLLGGGENSAPNPQRKITEIEKEIMQSLLRILTRGLHDAWSSVVKVDFDVQFLADEPYLVHVLSPTEAVVAIGIETQVGQTTEMINFAIPSIFIKQLRHMFDRLRKARNSDLKQEDQMRIADLLRAARMELEVRLEGATVPTRELLKLKVGDVLQLDYPAGGEATAMINGRPRFLGKLASSGTRLACQIARDYDTG